MAESIPEQSSSPPEEGAGTADQAAASRPRAAAASRPTPLSPPPHRPRVLLIVESSMAFGRGVLEGISRYLVENPPWSVHLDLRELLVTPPAWLRRWDGDGIITRSTTPGMVKIIHQLGIPTVNLTDIYGDQGLPRIWNDHRQIGRLAANHLIERGFQNFAYCGFSDHHWSGQREAGFAEALAERGFQPVSHKAAWAQARRRGWETQQADIAQWLRTLRQPTGIMACNDLRGQHVLEACRTAGLVVPEQIAVIGVDNDRVLCDFCEPPLTSVMPAAERIGYEAAAMLDRLMRGETLAQDEVLVRPLGIATRQSTDVLAIDDPEVVRSLQIIRQRACDGLTVADILREVPVARSVLERRFRKYVGRSPQAEIRSAQLKRACQLLQETDLPLAQIAALCGFKHPEYFSVVFKRGLGLTPGSYRNSTSSAR